MPSARDPQFITYIFMFVGLVIIAGLILARTRRGGESSASSTRATSEPARPDDTGLATPLCKCCGRAASRTAPEVVPRAGRWDSMLRAFGFPPRYVLRIPNDAMPDICDVHGRMADVLTEEELSNAVTIERRSAETRIIKRVATFATSLKSGIAARLIDNLADDQKPDARARFKPDAGAKPERADNVVPLRPTGTGQGD